MFSTMQDEPLSLATLLRYASTFQSDATVSTWTGDGIRSITFGEVGEQAARLANALCGLGVGVGDRVATFMWKADLTRLRSSQAALAAHCSATTHHCSATGRTVAVAGSAELV